ncbi:YrhB domain-containing protein [Microtetraspora malaysiensis]|uniref:YrhB domain-containing protein n=1 Tax=Microtetraspora malaysiensis TaxID=161358 RepID=UPI000A035A2E|nr:YrhB domain-containing protein [Microtetraspora malaysiensis]
MLTEPEARGIAEERLARIHETTRQYTGDDDGFVIVDVEEYPIGWAYYFQHARYVRTGDIGAMLGGNAPILIDRRDGTILPTGTAYPLEHYINEHTRLVPTSDEARA